MLKEELENRLTLIQHKITKEGLDCLVVASEENIWYITNITYKPEERPFFIIITPNDKPTLVVPKLEEEHLKKGLLDCTVISYWEYPAPNGESWHDVLNDRIKEYERIGMEETIPAHIFQKIAGKELVQTSLLETIRKVKSAYEISKIKYSAKIAVQAMKKIVKSVYLGQSVLEPFTLSSSIQKELIKTKKYDPITTSLLSVVWPAPISAMPHAIPHLADKIEKGPNIAMSYFRINGYASECERTLFLDKPTKDDEEHFHHMMVARNLALESVKPGVRTEDVDLAAKNYLIQQGYQDNLLHRTGHGIGLGNHEAPFMAEGSNEVLKENMVISIEPGIYLHETGGYRHSDTVLVTKDGYEILTPFPVELNDMVIKNKNHSSRLKGKVIQKLLKL